MGVSYFAYFELSDPAARMAPADLDRVTAVIAGLPRLRRGLVFTPTDTKTEHYFPDDPPAPALALQLQFDVLEDLEAVLRRDGALQALAAPDALPSLAGARVTHQAMTTRSFPVDEPRGAAVSPALSCSYLVHYPGAADDLNAWLAHYIDHHPAIMRKFPGVRAIEIYTRVDWVGFMPWQRVDHMQRNKLVFDDPSALTAALFSPVIAEMRADFARFPKFTGGNVHFPMLTREIVPGRAER
ncbi:hypothetical protein MXD81_51910 [Microbacteriaceae bacterium K1510]|nr:hypothetical protein [Microbacteriaceae bacterium K1510]